MFKYTEVNEIMLNLAGYFIQAKNSRHAAFTLAEVLITLTIIGVVAALTLTNLIYSYKKRLIETRLVHFSSMWMQAVQMAEAEHGETTTWDGIPVNDPDAMLDSYNKYLGKYIKTVEYHKTPKGVAFALPNGSGFHYRKTADPETWREHLFLTFCVHYDTCKNIEDNSNDPSSAYYDGKEKFHFNEVGVSVPVKIINGVRYNMSREELLEDCRTNHYKCVALIQHDGWKIMDDYPVKL